MYINAHNIRSGKKLKTITFTDFRKKASSYFSDVERGETLVILRHGKAIAEISPVENIELKIPSWKNPGLRISLNGSSLSQAILEEREVHKLNEYVLTRH